MDLVTWARSPWGEDILTHISWSLFYASLVGGVLFLLAHGGYMLFSRHHKRESAEVDRMEAERLSDRLAIMDHGEVLVEGTPRALMASLGGDHVVEFESSHE